MTVEWYVFGLMMVAIIGGGSLGTYFTVKEARDND